MFLVRMVTRAKWAPKSGLSAGEVPADGVTADLRTQSNSLSFWRSPTAAISDVEEAALAIAAGRERVDRLQVVWLDYDEIQTDDQTLSDTEGRTPVKDLKSLHVDVCRLDYIRLGQLANRVVDALASDNFHTFTKDNVAKLVARAVEQDRIDLEELKGKLRKEVRSLIDQGI